jgi:hypothetical protein
MGAVWMKNKKFKKLITLTAVWYALSGCLLIAPNILNQVVYAADDTTTTVPSKVNIKIHKLMYDKTIGSNLDTDKNGTIDSEKAEGLLTDGHEKSSIGDLSTWDKSQYGDIGFTLYDITVQIGDIKKLTEAKINTIIEDVEIKGANSTYIKNAPSNPEKQDVDANGIVTFENMPTATANNTYKIYLAVETKTPKGFLTQKARPQVIATPMTTKNGGTYFKTIHLYPKNQKQKLAIQLRKKSKSIEKTTAESLKGAKFQLYSGKAPGGNKMGGVLTTDVKGYITAENLVVGDYYFVEVPSSVADYADKVTAGDGKYVINANAMNNAENKLGFSIGADGMEVVGSGDPNDTNIIVTSYDTELINYERPKITKELKNGTDIKVGTVDKDGHYSFDIGEESHHELEITVPEDLAGGENGVSNAGTKYTTLPYSTFVVKDRPVVGDLLYVEKKGDIIVSTEADGKGTKFVQGEDYYTRTVKDANDKVIGFDVVFVDEENGRHCSQRLKVAAGKKVYINYDITVDQTAHVDTPLINKVALDWAVGGHQGVIPDEDVLYTYAARIKKVDSGIFGTGISNKALKGSEFLIKNAEGKYYGGKFDNDNDAVSEVVWTTDESLARAKGKFVSNEEGLLTNGSDKGLVGVDEGIYQLKEIKAPAGYNLLPEAVDLVVNKLTDGNSPQDLPPYEVRNDQTYVFHTGSREILLISIITTISIIGAIGLFIYHRHQKI